MVTSRSIQTSSYFSARLFCLLIIFVLLFAARICISSELLIGTGKVDSFSYFAGKSICHSIKKYDENVRCRPVPGEDYTDSLTNLQGGYLDMALVSSKMIYDALHGAGFFKYINIPYDNLRLLTPFYLDSISLVVRRNAGISSLNDLAGKRVNAGALHSMQNQVFSELVVLKDWQKDTFSLYQNLSPTNAQDLLALKSGSVQAMLHIGVHPDSSLRQLLVQSRSELIGLNDVDVNRLIDSRSGFCKSTIDAGTYPGLPNDLNSLATETLLITSADTDEGTVELVLNAIAKTKRQLQQVHPSFLQNSTGIEILNDSYLPPHPAARLFFQTNRNGLQ